MKILNIKIAKTSNSTSVKARAIIDFGFCEVRGFKILHDEKTNKEFVTPPSYFNGKSWIPLFKTQLKEEWADLCSQVIDKYNESLIEETLLEDR